MKVVIIGGGIAGLALGIFLKKRNIEVVINERVNGMPAHGHAFLMHINGLAILNELTCCNNGMLPGKKVDSFRLKRPCGKDLKYMKLTSWQCIKRVDLIRFLYSIFPAENINEGRVFSHFLYENGKISAAAFLNGAVEYGDIFVGADGSNSKVRELLFGKLKFTAVRVKEIVGVCSKNIKKSKNCPSVFTKYLNKENGLAFGMIPTSEHEHVWFMQYDSAISDVLDSSPEAIKAFCRKLLKKFPPVVSDIIEANDFSTTYIWNTRDFDLLPSFHSLNVVLVGDAAHLALPFTSSGTTNAIVDAKTLSECLEKAVDYKKAFRKLYEYRLGEVLPRDSSILNKIKEDAIDYERAFSEFYELRASEIAQNIEHGRYLKNLFLNPNDYNEDELPVPLMSSKPAVNGAAEQPIRVLYFTDPICSTCWIIQPILRKLKLEYGKYLNVEYRMGGLLPSWEEYVKGKISKPSDAAKHWEEVCVLHEMPMDGDVWIEDPLASSFPPSVAFKAAQIQDTEKALVFLRRIKEMVFMEKKNIIKWEFLERAAYDSGLDSVRLLRDFEGKAREHFKADLMLAKQLGVTGFPTLFFSDGIENSYTIKGIQPYESYEDIIYKLFPAAVKEVINKDPEHLFGHFPTMTVKEFSFLTDLPKHSATGILTELYKNGDIDKYESKNGEIWISKFAAA